MATAEEIQGNEQKFVSLLDVDGRTYRHFDYFKERKVQRQRSGDGETYEIEEDSSIVFDKTSNSYSLVHPVPRVYFKFLIGKAGAVKSKLERETGAKISIPKPTEDKDEVVIKGSSPAIVSSMRTRVEIIVESSTKSLPYSHFICVPLNTDPWRGKAEKLLETIEREGSDITGYDPSLGVKPERLHLTLLMLKLHTKELEETAIQTLKELGPKVYDAVGTRTVMVRLRGLAVMDETPSSAHVLYATVDEGEERRRLENAGKVITNEFKARGLVGSNEPPLKLHATLLNSRHRKAPKDTQKPSTTSGSTRDQSERLPFDARQILDRYGKMELGNGRVPEIQLCALSHSDTRQEPLVQKDGWYITLAKISLP